MRHVHTCTLAQSSVGMERSLYGRDALACPLTRPDVIITIWLCMPTSKACICVCIAFSMMLVSFISTTSYCGFGSNEALGNADSLFDDGLKDDLLVRS